MENPFALFCALLALPSGALADCPSSADLDRGIRFHIEGGDTEVFRRYGPDVIASVYSSGGEDTRVLLGRGMYVLEVADMSQGAPVAESATVYAFPMAPSEMPLPSPEAGWTVNVAVKEAQGLDQELQIYSFGPLSEVSFGECVYTMIPVIQSYRPDPFEVVDFVNWLPELGLSYLVRSTDVDGEDRYVYSGIERVD
ncbi:hypothetical protein M4578_21230 [Salipiger sp. P9]|uniref:hypothetical protein n=1 Tax=Salipiger pentaromativorans TaxID=2943193 RepID=UPI002157FAEA|nr:hypothetical protein [Salipiger pentaromativorans]MCR8550353.1 hypothetical protein [Salipiger pentaromativorans]